MVPGTGPLQPASKDAEQKEKLMIEIIFNHPWVWIMPIVIAFFLILAVVSTVIWNRERSGHGSGEEDAVGAAAWILWIVSVVLAGFYFGAMLPPYDTSFHATYRITGEVDVLEKGFTGDGDGVVSPGFVIGVEGVDDYLIWSDDQRFRTIEIGDDVNLVCGKVFRYFQEPYYDCSFAG